MCVLHWSIWKWWIQIFAGLRLTIRQSCWYKEQECFPHHWEISSFLCKFCDTKIIVLVCQQICMVALSRSCKVFLRYINVVWVRKWMHKKPFSRSEIQFLTLTKGMVVFNNYLRFQESLPLIFYNVPVNRACACFVSLFPIAEVAHFCACKLAKQRRISSQMVSRWSHVVEVQYNRWNHYKVEALHTCAILQAPSWFAWLF